MKPLLMICPNDFNPDFNLAEFFKIAERVDGEKFLFCKSVLPDNKLIKENNCKIYPQLGCDKAEIMMNAFLKAFLKEYKKIVWIDLNLVMLSERLVISSLTALDTHEVVMAGGVDEKVHLLGMKNFYSQIFEGEISVKQICSALTLHEISFLKTSEPILTFSAS